MKKIFSILCFFISAAVFSEGVEKFSLSNGIPVYVKADSSSRMCAYYLVIKGGVHHLTAETSGLEQAAFDLMKMGSLNYSYSDRKSFAYETQGSFTSYCIEDGSVLGFVCIDKHLKPSLEILSDTFIYPSFNEREYKLLMQSYREAIAGEMNEPASLLNYYTDQVIYAGHPFAAKTYVTQDSLENLTLPAIKNHYKTLLDSRRISIVVCGSVKSDKVLSLSEKYFSSLKTLSSALPSDSVPEISVSGLPMVFVHQSISSGGHATRVFKSPEVTSPDYPVSRIVCDIYSDILFNIVREKYGVCYTPSSGVASGKAPYGEDYFYRVSNFDEIKDSLKEAEQFMKNGLIPSGKNKDGTWKTDRLEDRLEGYKNSYVNKKFATQASVSGVASRIAAGLLQFGDIAAVDRLTVMVKSCTAEDVLRVYKQWWLSDNYRWFAVTNPDSEDEVMDILLKLSEQKSDAK